MRKMMLLSLTAIIATGAGAQQPASVTLYSKGHFTGSRLVISRPTSKLAAFDVKSVEISPGTVWELCSGNTFSGCERITQSRVGIARTVRSVRPVSPPIAQDVAVPGDGAPTREKSMRGLASEFFVVPAESGSRVEVTSQGQSAELGAANQFCRGRGWRASAYERVQTVGGRTYLADVLCDNQGR